MERHRLIATSEDDFVRLMMGLVLFALYYANWTFGWIQVQDLDFYN